MKVAKKDEKWKWNSKYVCVWQRERKKKEPNWLGERIAETNREANIKREGLRQMRERAINKDKMLKAIAISFRQKIWIIIFTCSQSELIRWTNGIVRTFFFFCKEFSI